MSLRSYAPGIHGWSRYQTDRGYEFNGLALASGDGTVVVVDPVPVLEEEVASLRALGRRFVIVLLNCDHERDAARLAPLLDAPIQVSAFDASSVRAPVAATLKEGDVLPGGWIFHALQAMKTPGESALHHPQRRALVIGDAIIADPVTGVRLVPHAKLPDRAGALASLAKMAALDFDALYPGDGFVLPCGGREALRRFLAKEGIAA